MELSLLLARPALWFPNQSSDDWQEELYTMLESSLALGDFINGKIDAEQYLDRIESIGIDPLSIGDVLDDASTI